MWFFCGDRELEGSVDGGPAGIGNLLCAGMDLECHVAADLDSWQPKVDKQARVVEA
jgi:hypothetical protein